MCIMTIVTSLERFNWIGRVNTDHDTTHARNRSDQTIKQVGGRVFDLGRFPMDPCAALHAIPIVTSVFQPHVGALDNTLLWPISRYEGDLLRYLTSSMPSVLPSDVW